ncbi:MAG: MBL fold metallo-hydrolase [Clostridia bacterium]|nr:MBL fold metallo-hydrolase [Clostridia bacterium]
MKFRYLGTAAAEGFPSMFCTCESCKRARNAGGRNIRTRSQAVIDDRLLIDFPADTYMHVLQLGLDMTKINHCIITHSHNDHLDPGDFIMRQKGFAYLQAEAPLTIYGTQATVGRSQQVIDATHLERQGRVVFRRITPFVPFEVDGYRVTPLMANHDPLSDPVMYIINDGRKALLYAHDTGYFPRETWNYLESCRPHFDFVSLDCTLGTEECVNSHMGIHTAVEVKERLIQMQTADQDTVFCFNHFSHNGKAIYNEMVPIAKKYDALVSFDGMALEI